DETIEPEPVPELTLENIRAAWANEAASVNDSFPFVARSNPDGEPCWLRGHPDDCTPIPEFDPPLVEWVQDCEGEKLVVRVPPGMCAGAGGTVKQITPANSSSCGPSVVNTPSCSFTEQLEFISHPNGTVAEELYEFYLYHYTPEQCDPEMFPGIFKFSPQVNFYEGACGG